MKFLFLLFLPIIVSAQSFTKEEIKRYTIESKNVNIIRDTWGVPHIYGKTDAEAVFGLLYAQCEDDFRRVEMNSLEMLGRTAEVNGESSLYKDLQMRMIYDSLAAISDYKDSPPWFKKLLDASADGVNYYLYKHPGTPSVLKRFEPWYALMRTDGSIDATSTGGIKVDDIKAFYSGKQSAINFNNEPSENVNGSNGFAISPSKTITHNALLYINPHVTFYFREEVQMVSNQGLNAYGAVTWGQFFIYQGFNQHCGWMHTSSHADVADVYMEKVISGRNLLYSYNDSLLPVEMKPIKLYYKNGLGKSPFTVMGYFTHHGPILAKTADRWLAVKEYNRSLKALMQSWLRTKSGNYAEFEQVMDMRANTTNNTVYADDKGNIAYWHGNFMPRRDPSYNWSLPVDGTTSATEWKGVHELKEIVQVHNPITGWIQNCNSTPYTVSGNASPGKNNYPGYMAPDGQNPRAINAMRLLDKENKFTLDKLTSLGYDTYLSAFEILLPSLFKAYDEHGSLLKDDSLKTAMSLLRAWDKKSSEQSIATTLAIEWATLMSKKVPAGKTDEERSNSIGFLESVAHNVPAAIEINLLQEVLTDLVKKFGTWQVPWGKINGYQRADYDLGEKFDDAKPVMKVGLASSIWGCLPGFSSVTPPGSKYKYGVSGNSFIAAVEFGKRVKARSILTGGEGTTPSSKHYLDQADMYIHGKFKDVWFYKEDVMKHIESMYHPGEEKLPAN